MPGWHRFGAPDGSDGAGDVGGLLCQPAAARRVHGVLARDQRLVRRRRGGTPGRGANHEHLGDLHRPDPGSDAGLAAPGPAQERGRVRHEGPGLLESARHGRLRNGAGRRPSHRTARHRQRCPVRRPRVVERPRRPWASRRRDRPIGADRTGRHRRRVPGRARRPGDCDIHAPTHGRQAARSGRRRRARCPMPTRCWPGRSRETRG